MEWALAKQVSEEEAVTEVPETAQEDALPMAELSHSGEDTEMCERDPRIRGQRRSRPQSKEDVHIPHPVVPRTWTRTMLRHHSIPVADWPAYMALNTMRRPMIMDRHEQDTPPLLQKHIGAEDPPSDLESGVFSQRSLA